mmetsp:Transcript_27566/g.51217  ORF Transcript_27566/g.51217 Transcript_27566/m.51217 type:complete len:364 (-) Transcript_27566:194-1285(-)
MYAICRLDTLEQMPGHPFASQNRMRGSSTPQSSHLLLWVPPPVASSQQQNLRFSVRDIHQQYVILLTSGQPIGTKKRVLPNQRLYLFEMSSDETPPSCIDRFVAAVTADMVALRKPPFSSASTPAIVVPPGDVTPSFSCPGCLPVCRTISAAPFTICAASCVATALGRPHRTPPSERASMNWNTYAGPDPERPVTASRFDSVTSTATPTDPKIFSTTFLSLGDASLPRAKPLAASPTRQGVLGMTRTTLRPGSKASRVSSVTPARILMTTASLSTALMQEHAASTTFGFTAMIMTSFARLHTSLLSGVAKYPCSDALLRLGSNGSEQEMSTGSSTTLLDTKPCMRAEAIMPAPMKPTLDIVEN